MEWHNRRTLYQCYRSVLRGRLPEEEYYANQLIDLAKPGSPDVCKAAILSESHWVAEKKPFYNVWPSIVEPLLKVKLDIPVSRLLPLEVRMPAAVLARFAVGKEPRGIRSFMFARVVIDDGGKLMRGIQFTCDVGEEMLGQPVTWDHAFPLDGDATVEDHLRDCPKRELSDDETQVVADCIRIWCGILMMQDDLSIIEPVVLAKHRDKYAATGDPRYIEKAKGRGVYGWNLGARLEVIPHLRRPHFAIRWTGPGKTIPKLTPIKGSIVHCKKMSEVPTGHLNERSDDE